MGTTSSFFVPHSPQTVSVSIINTTGTIRGVHAKDFYVPEIPGSKWLAGPIYSFIIKHPTLNRTLLFDLGLRKDWHNLPPVILDRIKAEGWELKAEKNVSQIILGDNEAGVRELSNVEAII